VALTNTAPSAATDTNWSAGIYPPPAAANGYPSGGATPTVTTATSGGIGPFRYVILYNASAGNGLLGFYDYGSSVTLNATDTFTTDFDDTSGVLTVS